MKELRINMEEIVIQGDECEQDVRMVNSYPSKVVLARVVSCPRGQFLVSCPRGQFLPE